MRALIVEALARALLTSDWTRRGMIAAVTSSIEPPIPFAEALVDGVRARFSRPPRLVVLCRFIDTYEEELEALPPPTAFEVAAMPLAMFAPRWPVRVLEDVPSIARWLEMPLGSLEGWADVRGYLDRAPPGPMHHYVRYRSGARLIEAPKAQLAKIQRRILGEILERIPVHPAAHGFVRGRSFATNARMHAGRSVVARFDLQRFFPSIRRARVYAVFMAAGYPEAVAEVLAGLTTVRTPRWFRAEREYGARHLPQGAPTSPYLANLVAFGLDVRMAGLAAKHDAIYTRYADDMVFSFDAHVRDVTSAVRAIVEDEGFALNERKTRWMRSHRRQTVTGLVVNAAPAVTRRERKRLEAELCGLARAGAPVAAVERDRLRGRVAHVEHANAVHGRRLRRWLERIVWVE